MLTPDLLAELDQVLAMRRDRPREEATTLATNRLLRRASYLDRAAGTPRHCSRRLAITRVLCDASLSSR